MRKIFTVILVIIAGYFAVLKYQSLWKRRATLETGQVLTEISSETAVKVCQSNAADEINRLTEIFGSDYSSKTRGLIKSYSWQLETMSAFASFTKGRLLLVSASDPLTARGRLIQPRLLAPEKVFNLRKTTLQQVVARWGPGIMVGMVWKSTNSYSNLQENIDAAAAGQCQSTYAFYPKEGGPAVLMVFEDDVLLSLFN
jgi:hypothetical protein